MLVKARWTEKLRGEVELFTKFANIIESGISSPFDCALLLTRGASVLICQGRGGGDASELTKNYVRTVGTYIYLGALARRKSQTYFLLATYRWLMYQLSSTIPTFFLFILIQYLKILTLIFNDIFFDQFVIDSFLN